MEEGDLLDRASIRGSFADVDAAYYLVHSMKAGGDFAKQDISAASNFAEEASNAGVERVIYLGGLGETGVALSEHLQSRRDVEAVLAGGNYALTTLRAAVIIGRESASFTMIRQLAERLPVMITPKWVRTKCQPIAIDDVIAYLTRVLDKPETAGKTFEIGGPEVLTYEQMIKQTARHLGRRLFIIPIPLLTPQLSVYWVDFVTDIPKSVAHPLIYGLKNPVVVTNDEIRTLIPMALTSFDTAVQHALSSHAPLKQPIEEN